MTITVDTTDRRDGKALALFARCAEWQQGKTKDGRSFFAIPGSERGLLHMTDTRDCSCADRQRSRNVCKHMRAVRLWMAAFQTGVVAPKPRTSARTEDVRIALTPAGAKYIASRQVRLTPTGAAPISRSSGLISPLMRQRFGRVGMTLSLIRPSANVPSGRLGWKPATFVRVRKRRQGQSGRPM